MDYDAVKASDVVKRYAHEEGQPRLREGEYEQLIELFEDVLQPSLIQPDPNASDRENVLNLTALAHALQLGADAAVLDVSDELQQSNDTLKSQLESTSNQLQSERTRITALTNERDQLKSTVSDMQAETQQLKSQNERKDEEITRLQELAQRHANEAAAANKKPGSASHHPGTDDDDEVTALQRALQEARDETDAYQRMYAEQQHFVDDLESQVRRLQAQLSGQTEHESTVAQENTELRNANSELQNDLQQKNSELNEQQRRINELESSLESERNSSNQELKRVQSELERTQQQLAEREREVQEHRDEAMEARSTKRHLLPSSGVGEEESNEDRIARLEWELTEAEEGRQKLEEDCRELERKLYCHPPQQADSNAPVHDSVADTSEDEASKSNFASQLKARIQELEEAVDAGRTMSDSNVKELKQRLEQAQRKYSQMSEELQKAQLENSALRERAGYGIEDEVDIGAYKVRSISELEHYKLENRRLQEEMEQLQQDRRNLRRNLLTGGGSINNASVNGNNAASESDAASSELKMQLREYEAEGSSLRTKLEQERAKVATLEDENRKLRQDLVQQLQEMDNTESAWNEIVSPLIESLRSNQRVLAVQSSQRQHEHGISESIVHSNTSLEEYLERYSKELEAIKQIAQRTENYISPNIHGNQGEHRATAADDEHEQNTHERLRLALQELEQKDSEREEIGNELQRLQQHCEQSADQRRLLYDEYIHLREKWHHERTHLQQQLEKERSENESKEKELGALRSSESVPDAVRRSAKLEAKAEKAERALQRAISRESVAQREKLDIEARLTELSRVYNQRLVSLDHAVQEAQNRAEKLERDREMKNAVPWSTYSSLCEEQRQLQESHQKLLAEKIDSTVSHSDAQQARDRQAAAESRAIDAEEAAETLKKQCEHLEHALAQIHNGVEKSDDTIAELDRLRASKASQDANVESLQRQAERAQKQREHAENEKKSMEEELRKAEAQASEHAGQVSSAKAAERRALELVEDCVRKSDHEQALEAVKAENRDLKEELNAARRIEADYHRLHEELAKKETEIKSVQEELRSLRNSHVENGKNFDSRYKELQDQVANARRREVILEGKLRVSELEGDRLYTEASRLYKALHHRTEELLQCKSEKRACSSAHRAALRQLEAQVAGSGTGREEQLTDALHRSASTNKKLQDEISRLRNRNKELSEQVSHYESRAKVSNLQDDMVSKCRNGETDAWQEAQRLSHEAAQSELRANKAERQLKIALERANFAESQAEECNETISRLEESLQSERASSSERISRMSRRVAELEEKCSDHDQLNSADSLAINKLPDEPVRRELASLAASHRNVDAFDNEAPASMAQAQEMLLQQVERLKKLRIEKQELIEELERVRQRAERAENKLSQVEHNPDIQTSRVGAPDSVSKTYFSNYREDGDRDQEDSGDCKSYDARRSTSTIERLKREVKQRDEALERANATITRLREYAATQQEDNGGNNDINYPMDNQHNAERCESSRRAHRNVSQEGQDQQVLREHVDAAEQKASEVDRKRRDELAEKQSEIDRLTEELESTKAQVPTQPNQSTEVSKLRLQIQQKDKKIAQLREAVKELEHKYAEALKAKSDDDMRDSAAESAKHLQNQVSSLQEKIRSMNSSLEESKERERSLEQQRQRLERHAASLPSNEQMRALQQRYQNLQQQNQNLTQQLQQLQQQQREQQSQRTRQQIQRNQQEEQSWEAQLASFSKENSKLKKRIESMKSKVSNREQELESANQHISKLQEYMQRTERQKQASASQQQSTQKAKQASSLQSLHRENEQLNAEIAQLKKQTGENGKLKHVEDELERLRSERRDNTQDETVREIQELQDANFDKESMILELRFECEQQRARAERLEGRLEEAFNGKQSGDGKSQSQGTKRSQPAPPTSSPGREQELEEVVHGLRKVVERLRNENSSLRQRTNPQKHDQLNRQVRNLHEQVNELKQERDGAKQQAKELEQEKKRLAQEVASNAGRRTHTEASQWSEEKQRLEQRVRKAEEEAASQQQLSQRLHAELEHLQQQLHNASSNGEEEEGQMPNAPSKVERAEKAVDASAPEVGPERCEQYNNNELQQQFAQLEQENQDLRAELEALDPAFFQEVVELKRKYAEQAEILRQYEAQLSQFASRLGTTFVPYQTSADSDAQSTRQ